jgi:methanogenic corrinoid protein MtbC1
MQQPVQLMSIGALSRATGVPADTLRTWERRYGFPLPERTDSGHRRYSSNTLQRLRLVTRLLELGHRPSTVLGADETALRELLAQSSAASSSGPSEAPAQALDPHLHDSDTIAGWLEHISRYEGREFDRALARSWAIFGAMAFLERRVAPFLEQLGQQWESGRLGVRHEHFASERLREFLAQRWRPLSDAAAGPAMVLATLPGERHVIGLHMAALTLALNNVRVVWLGADAPPEEIARAVAHHGALAVVLSSAAGADPERTGNDLDALRAALPAQVRLVVGGAGFAECRQDVDNLPSFSALSEWVEAL